MLETQKPSPAVGGRTRRPATLLVSGAIILALVVAGTWAIVANSGTNEMEVATELADDLMAAWSGTDPAAVVALYTENGVHIPPQGWEIPETRGRDALLTHIEGYLGRVSDAVRTGDVKSIGDGCYTYSVDFLAAGSPFSALIEIELEGDRASRVEFLNTSAG